MRTISATELLGRPVGAVAERCRVGRVAEVIVDPNLGKAAGLLVRLDWLGWRDKVLDWRDLRDADKDGVVIASAGVLLEVAEVVRVKELLNHDFNLLRLPVVTTDGTKLGWVSDFELVWETGDIVSLSVKSWCRRPPLLIKKSAIVRITLHEVVVRRAAAHQKRWQVAAVPSRA